jgi:hypothetical protein
MRLFRFRALLTLDSASASEPGRAYLSGTRALMVHASRIGLPASDRYFPATITWDEERDLRCGDTAVVTITVADESATAYLDAGQPFELWGDGSGHGVISRRVFTDGGPS